jgi:aryl-alcohol dehydrogenase-like predicted oxidoreductase
MEYRELGSTGLRVSAIAFGGGPISGLMVGDATERQRRVVRRAIDAGINWFDTAAGYGDGQSERSLGRALAGVGDIGEDLHVATKVRLAVDQLGDIRRAVRESFATSLERLGLERVTLLQLHNSVTTRRGDLPTSVTPDDVLGRGGVIEAFEELRARELVDHFGFTGLGDAASLTELIDDGRFASAQIPFNVLTPIAGEDRSAGSVDVDYEQLIESCARREIGVLAIRLFAGGALTGQNPSPHTLETKFFPLDLFQRDVARAQHLDERLPPDVTRKEAAVRFVLAHAGISTAIVGFASEEQIDEVLRLAAAGPLDPQLAREIGRL